MRVAVDATFLGTGRGGDETFLRGVLEGLATRRGATDTFPLLVGAAGAPGSVRGDPAFEPFGVPARPGPWHFAVTLPRRLRTVPDVDLALSVTHAPLWGAVPSAVVVGDLSFVHRPADYPRVVATRLGRLVPHHVRTARVVVVPSEFTRDDVVRTYGVDPANVRVVPNRVPAPGPADGPDVDAADAWLRRAGVRAPYLLYLGNLHPRKNVPRLIDAFVEARRGDARLAGHQFVVAGARWWRGGGEQGAAADRPGVVLLGAVPETVKARLLAGAEALAYVSLFEGFGLPPLEAMSYGTPVLASATTSLPEVCGDAALLVDPHDPDAVRDGVRRVLTDDALRTRLRRAGPERAAGFDAARVGDAALTAFRHALDLPIPTTVRPAGGLR